MPNWKPRKRPSGQKRKEPRRRTRRPVDPEELPAAGIADNEATPSESDSKEAVENGITAQSEHAAETAQPPAAFATEDSADDTGEETAGAAPEQPAAAVEPAPTTQELAATAETRASERAGNDPREQPKPVAEVVISTERFKLFPESSAPALSPPDRIVPRAINDPREVSAHTFDTGDDANAPRFADSGG